MLQKVAHLFAFIGKKSLIFCEHGFYRGIQQRNLMDIGIGVVNENARLHIALCVNMQVTASTGDAAADILRIVLEVHEEDGLAVTVFADAVINRFPLLWSGQQLLKEREQVGNYDMPPLLLHLGTRSTKCPLLPERLTAILKT